MFSLVNSQVSFFFYLLKFPSWKRKKTKIKEAKNNELSFIENRTCCSCLILQLGHKTMNDYW